MRVLGVDPSSSSIGWAVAEDGQLLTAGVIINPSPKDKHDRDTTARGLALAFSRLMEVSAEGIDRVVIEQVSSMQGAHTVRMISYFEVPGMLVAHMRNATVHMLQPNSARTKAFGSGFGNRSKNEIRDHNKQSFADRNFWLPVPPLYNDDYNGDISDGIVLAFAGFKL